MNVHDILENLQKLFSVVTSFPSQPHILALNIFQKWKLLSVMEITVSIKSISGMKYEPEGKYHVIFILNLYYNCKKINNSEYKI